MSNPVMRWQVISPESDQLAGFYTKLFGWEASRNNMMNYQMMAHRQRARHRWRHLAGAGRHAHLRAAVHRSRRLRRLRGLGLRARGDRADEPPQALPDGDVMAILKDPAGMSFGIMQAAAV